MCAMAAVLSLMAIGVKAAPETGSAVGNNIRQAEENINDEKREPSLGNRAEGRERSMPGRNGQPGEQPEEMTEETVQAVEPSQYISDQSPQAEEQLREITDEQAEEQQQDIQSSDDGFEERLPPEMPPGGRENFGEEMMNREEQSQSFIEENFTVISAGVLLAAAFAFVLLYKRREY